MMSQTALHDRSTGPDPIDIHVGRRLKQRRVLSGVSQEKLAEALGITFQQIQKYENGSNRVGASRLYQIGQVLNVPVSHFFEGFSSGSDPVNTLGSTLNGGNSATIAGATSSGVGPGIASGPVLMAAEDTPDIPDDIMNRRETLELVKAYYAITNEDTRKKMLGVLRSVADATPTATAAGATSTASGA